MIAWSKKVKENSKMINKCSYNVMLNDNIIIVKFKN